MIVLNVKHGHAQPHFNLFKSADEHGRAQVSAYEKWAPAIFFISFFSHFILLFFFRIFLISLHLIQFLKIKLRKKWESFTLPNNQLIKGYRKKHKLPPAKCLFNVTSLTVVPERVLFQGHRVALRYHAILIMLHSLPINLEGFFSISGYLKHTIWEDFGDFIRTNPPRFQFSCLIVDKIYILGNFGNWK